ncbi:MAG TPA: hypothetical protein VE913_06725 [Longimicrobium sp.]|nr:hypothetical protein [Longimicrobium sp.]
MPDEITYRVDFTLSPPTDPAALERFLGDVVSIDVHPERVEAGLDGVGAILYVDPPVAIGERCELIAWLRANPRIKSFSESVVPVAGLEYEFITLAAPVQAAGTIAGRPLYFRARWREWSFAVADEAWSDAVLIDAADCGGWYRGGVLADKHDASYLPRAEAESIIQICAREYLAGGLPRE